MAVQPQLISRISRRCNLALLLALMASGAMADSQVLGKAMTPNRLDRNPSTRVRSYLPADLWDNCYLWQTFNTDDSGAYYDLRSTAYDGAATTGKDDPTYTNAGAMAFNGSSTSITFPSAGIDAAVSNQYSILAWVKQLGAVAYKVIGGGQSTNAPTRYIGNLTTASAGDGYQFYIRTDVEKSNPTDTDGTQSNQWTLVCGVYDGATVYLYVDGLVSDYKSRTGDVVDFDDMPFGADIDTAQTRYFTGLIGEIQVFDCAISQEYIRAKLTRDNMKWWGRATNWASIGGGALDGLTTDGTNIYRTWDAGVWKYTEAGAETTNCTTDLCRDGYAWNLGGATYKDGWIYSLMGVYTNPYQARVVQINTTTLNSTTSVEITNLTFSANLIAWIDPYWYIGEIGSGGTGTNRSIYAYDTNWVFVGECPGGSSDDKVGWEDACVRDDVLYCQDHGKYVSAFSVSGTNLTLLRREVLSSGEYGEGITELNGYWYTGLHLIGAVGKRLRVSVY